MLARLVGLVAVLAVAGTLVWMPEPDLGRLAALELYTALEAPASAEEGAPSLADAVLDGPAVRPGEPGELVLDLGGVRLARTPLEGMNVTEPVGFELHGVARRALVRGLREAATERGLALRVEGEDTPKGTGGLQVLARFGPDALEVELTPDPDADEQLVAQRGWTPPERWSLAPPLVAILLAVLLRRPVIALFLGVVSAGWIVRFEGGATPLDALLAALAYVPDALVDPETTPGLWRSALTTPGEWLGLGAEAGAVADRAPDWVAKYFFPELVDSERAYIVAFVVFMLAMVGVVTRVGGIQGLMDSIARLARGVRSTQIVTWLLGLVVFFDDYANTILVGSTMRPLTDRFRIAREKLAYLVDSTAAPVAGLSVFSTWIAFEVSTFSAQLPAAGLTPDDGYAVFLDSLSFRFYSIFTLIFVGFVTLSGRDFGPMLTAERRARDTGQLVREGGQPMVSKGGTALAPIDGIRPQAAAALYPILTFLGVTLIEIGRGGGAFGTDWIAAARSGNLVESVTDVLYQGSGSLPLALGSFAGLFVAMAIAHAQGLSAFGEIARAAWTTLRALGVAILILYLAWMIGRACKDDLHTASYLTALLSDRLSPALLPTILFGLAALVALSTGSSWSTMSILLPLVVGLSYTLGKDVPELGGYALMVLSIGAVLEGAIFGDHCSPISDTTVLSSTASASDHIDHVRTQAPYALLTMVVALTCGYLPCALYPESWRWWYGLLTGIAVLLVVLLVFGRRSPGPAAAEALS